MFLERHHSGHSMAVNEKVSGDQSSFTTQKEIQTFNKYLLSTLCTGNVAVNKIKNISALKELMFLKGLEETMDTYFLKYIVCQMVLTALEVKQQEWCLTHEGGKQY